MLRTVALLATLWTAHAMDGNHIVEHHRRMSADEAAEPAIGQGPFKSITWYDLGSSGNAYTQRLPESGATDLGSITAVTVLGQDDPNRTLKGITKKVAFSAEGAKASNVADVQEPADREYGMALHITFGAGINSRDEIAAALNKVKENGQVEMPVGKERASGYIREYLQYLNAETKNKQTVAEIKVRNRQGEDTDKVIPDRKDGTPEGQHDNGRAYASLIDTLADIRAIAGQTDVLLTIGGTGHGLGFTSGSNEAITALRNLYSHDSQAQLNLSAAAGRAARRL